MFFLDTFSIVKVTQQMLCYSKLFYPKEIDVIGVDKGFSKYLVFGKVNYFVSFLLFILLEYLLYSSVLLYVEAYA